MAVKDCVETSLTTSLQKFKQIETASGRDHLLGRPPSRRVFGSPLTRLVAKVQRPPAADVHQSHGPPYREWRRPCGRLAPGRLSPPPVETPPSSFKAPKVGPLRWGVGTRFFSTPGFFKYSKGGRCVEECAGRNGFLVAVLGCFDCEGAFCVCVLTLGARRGDN